MAQKALQGLGMKQLTGLGLFWCKSRSATAVTCEACFNGLSRESQQTTTEGVRRGNSIFLDCLLKCTSFTLVLLI